MDGDRGLKFGDRVYIRWGSRDVAAIVEEVYGPTGNRKVTLRLEPVLSDFVVDETSTVTMPLDSVKKSRRVA